MQPEADAIRQTLKTVRWPGFDKDIVTAGFVKKVQVIDQSVIVHFASRTSSEKKNATMVADIQSKLSELPGVESVRVDAMRPDEEPVLTRGSPEIPLQSELETKGIAPEPDPILYDIGRGPKWDGGKPEGDGNKMAAPTYDGALPVYQWEIDPVDERYQRGEADERIGDWDFRMWWQVHPSEIAYASIQAIKEDTIDHGATARAHPVGRAVAVNLVYDLRRKAVVAIYGTATDFRPFVEAFRRGYGIELDSTVTDEEK
jgi:metal-sulfur cluster biosynthetic enzyme